MTAELEITRKRLLWRATHRGIKEMDILVGGYAQQHLSGMTAEQLHAFAVLVELPDQEILAWATRQEAVPANQDTPMLRAILNYRPLTPV